MVYADVCWFMLYALCFMLMLDGLCFVLDGLCLMAYA
jgi:hypothetical protein